MIESVMKVFRQLSGTVGQAAPMPTPGTPQASFGEVFREVASTAYDQLRSAESVSLAGLNGRASAQEVTQAVMAAELTLQTGVAVRDRAIAAYQDITRMPI